MTRLRLPSGCDIEGPSERLLRFCHEEYDYYDGIPSSDPDHVEPIDVLATVAVNAFSAPTPRRSETSIVGWQVDVIRSST